MSALAYLQPPDDAAREPLFASNAARLYRF